MEQYFIYPERDSQFGELSVDTSIIDNSLLIAASELPRNRSVVTFLDYDDTLLNGQRRYDVMPELQNFSGKDAYPEIAKKFGNKEDPTGLRNFVRALDPRNYLFENVADFYSPYDLNQIILTAGDDFFQREKIRASFGENVKSIVVADAKNKPNAMLEYFISQNFLPSEIVFYDDRIKALRQLHADIILSKGLGIPVFFLQATPNYKTKTIHLEEKFQETKKNIFQRIGGVLSVQ